MPNTAVTITLLTLITATALLTSLTTPYQVQATEVTYLNPGKDYFSTDDDRVILNDGFDNYTVNEFPEEGGWVLASPGKGPDYQTIVQEPAMGNKSLQLWGTLPNLSIIEHEINALPPSFTFAYYADVMVRIDEETRSVSGWSIEIELYGTPVIIAVSGEGITVAEQVITDQVPDGWVRVAAAYSPQTGYVTAWVNTETKTIQTQTTNTTPTKITIKTNTKTNIDNIKVKQVLVYAPIWENVAGGWAGSVAWSPDGDKIAVGTERQTVVTLSSSNGSVIWESKDLGDRVWSVPVWSVSFSPRGDRIVAGTGSGYVVVLSSLNGSILWERNVGGCVLSVAWSPNGQGIAVGGAGKVAVLSASNGATVWERNVSGSVVSVSWSPGSDRVAAAVVYDPNKSSVAVFSSLDGSVLWERRFIGHIYSVAFSPDGENIAIGTYHGRSPRPLCPTIVSYCCAGDCYGSIVILSSSDGEILWKKELGYDVFSVAWSPDGDRIVAGTPNGVVAVSPSSDTILWVTNLSDGVISVSWSPDGDRIAAGTYFGSIAVISSSSGALVWKRDTGGWVMSVSFSLDGSLVSAWVSVGSFVVFSSSDGTLIWKRNLEDGIISAAISPDKTKVALIVSCNDSKTVAVFSSSGEKLWESGDLGTAFSIAYSPDGKEIAVRIEWYNDTAHAYYSKIVVFNSSDGSIMWESTALKGSISSIIWSPDSSKLAAVIIDDTYHGVVVLSSFDGSILWKSPDLQGEIGPVAFSPDDEDRVAVVMNRPGYGVPDSYGSIVVYSLSEKSVTWEIPNLGNYVTSIAFSPDGSKLAVEAVEYINESILSPSLMVLSSSDGAIIWGKNSTIPSLDSGFAWSPKGGSIAVVEAIINGSRVVVYSASDGSIVWEKELSDYAYSIAYSPDGAMIAVGTIQGKIMVLSPVTGWLNTTGSLVPNGSVTFTVTGFSGLEYCWDFGDGDAVCALSAETNHSYGEGGWYMVSLTVKRGDTYIRTINQWIYIGAEETIETTTAPQETASTALPSTTATTTEATTSTTTTSTGTPTPNTVLMIAALAVGISLVGYVALRIHHRGS